MTVSSSVMLSGPYEADGVNDEWDFAFKIKGATHLKIFVADDEDGANTVEYTSGYTVDAAYLDKDAGGVVVYPSSGDPVEDGKFVWIGGNVPFEQASQFSRQGAYNPVAVMGALDGLSIQIKQISENIGRAVKAPPGAEVLTLDEMVQMSDEMAANAVTALTSAAEAFASAAAAAVDADEADAAAVRAIAAADAAGVVKFYDTKAAATADLASIAANAIIEVFADESQSGWRTRYQKLAGVLVFKTRMPTLYATSKASIWLPGEQWSMPAGYGAGTAAAINAAIAAVAAQGGGEVILPPETITLDGVIDNKYSRVLVKAMGGMRMVHGVAAGYGCKIVPTFAGTVLRHRSPRAAETGGIPGPRNDGGGFMNMSVVGNGIAKKLLEVDSIQWGWYHLFLEDCDGDTGLAVNRRFAAEFLCGTTGADLAEATNIQKMNAKLVIRQLSSGNPRDCGGVLLSGAPNSNVCFNDDIDLDIQHYNGTALQGDSADNNKLTFRAYRPAGTGLSVYGEGRKGSVVGFEGNWFERYSTNVAGYLEGTGDTDVTQGVYNNIDKLDNLNGTSLPTAGTGSKWTSISWDGLLRGYASLGLVISDNTATALSETIGLGTKGLVIANGSEAHLTLQNNSAAAKWLLRLITSSGNIQLLRQVGTGYFDLAGADAKMNALRLTDGITAPSTVAGQIQIYGDVADGDLKVKFGDGTVKTIVTDT